MASVHWVVRDLGATKAAWSRLGFRSVRDLGEMTVAGSFRGQSGTTRLRVATTQLAGLDVVWLQPVEGPNALTEFLARHGEGVFSINYQAPGKDALEAEVSRLSALGVGVLQRAQVPSGAGPLTIVHMDTESQGKYVLGLVHGAPPVAAPDEAAATAEGPPFPVKLSQYALVVESLQPVSDYWARLGFPAMDVTHPPLSDLRYHGEPGLFDQKLGWHRHGTVTWEWIEPLQGPTVYRDFLKAHGEGLPPSRLRRARHRRGGQGVGCARRSDRPVGGLGREGQAGLGALRLRRHEHGRRRDGRAALESALRSPSANRHLLHARPRRRV